MTDVNLKIRHAKRQNAQNLDLKECNLESIPNEVFQLKTLLNLNLSSNKLTTIDKAIENLKILTELNLENNFITSLPEEILSLPNLKYLRLTNNPIYDHLEDFNLNWKESLREYLKNKDKDKDKEVSTSQSQKIGEKFENNLSTNLNNQNVPFPNKKVPFTINSGMKINLHNHTLGNFNLLKRDSLTAQSNQPLDNKKNVPIIEGTTNTFISTKERERENLLLSSNNNNPIRIQSGNINKKLAMNTILKNRKSVNNVNTDKEEKIENEISSNLPNLHKEPNLNNETENNSHLESIKLKEKNDELEKLKNKIENLEIELRQIKQQNLKKEEDYKNNLRLLEGEIKNLKIKGDSEKKVENIITNKRNWMDNSSVSNQLMSNSGVSSIQNRNLEDTESKIKDLENQLQKESLSNKRLKNEVERLNQQLVLSKQNQNFSAENILKSKKTKFTI
jgi:hypothetical protein